MIVSLLSPAEIKTRVASLANEIARDYPNTAKDPLVLLIVLKGAMMFGCDLARELSHRRVRVVMDFISASSYKGGRASTGAVSLVMPRSDLVCKRVLVVEDIVDTGLTVTEIVKHLSRAGCASVKVVAMLDKHGSRKEQTEIHYTGIKIDNVFVVGYGLDDDGMYRELPYIGIVQDDVPSGTVRQFSK